MNQHEIKIRHSELNSISEWQTEVADLNNAKAVIWYYDEIVFLYNENWAEKLNDLSEIVRLRLFDTEKELHIWRSNGKLVGRLRKDISGIGEREYQVAEQILNGTRFEWKEGYLDVTEDKGIHYKLPFEELKGIDDTKNRIALVTRNYIGYSDIGQAGYVDSRFVDFKIV